MHSMFTTAMLIRGKLKILMYIGNVLQTQYHEEVLTALQKEEGELRERLQQLVQIEHRLVSRVEALQDHYQQQDLHSVSHLEQVIHCSVYNL